MPASCRQKNQKPVCLLYSASLGAWRSLVARIVRDDEAGGSNPLAPTNHSFVNIRRGLSGQLCQRDA